MRNTQILMTRPLAVLGACLLLAGCASELPEGTTEFTVGRTVVRTDSLLDVAGVLFTVSDTTRIAPRGPLRAWYDALQPLEADSALTAARAIGAAGISVILEAWAAPDVPDTACGWVTPSEHLCVSGNEGMRRRVGAFLATVPGAPARLPIGSLPRLATADRLQDLADVYTALTRGRALDSAVLAYSGFGDLSFDVVLARTLNTGGTTAGLDPARQRGPRGTIFLPPDPVYATDRSYRSPNYIWLMLAHQMSHAVVDRLFQERPELLARGFHLREATESEMGRFGYTGIFWNETLAEQLARAVTVRILRATNPTATWAARSDAVTQGMALVPWLEDVLARYEERRDSFPTLSAFAGPLGDALDAVPLDSCRGAPSALTLISATDRYRGVVRWIGADAPFRAQRLQVGDTVLAIDGDSVAASELLLPTRQLNVKWAQHLPAELGILAIRRGTRTYGVQVPINWGPRLAVRVASQDPSAVRVPGDSVLPICRWVTRARRTPPGGG